ncbi:MULTISPECIES: GNAT family N-acetyltransferase [unclassified Brevundimonas]|uniref:GNAT family N-acetyltransferase n=1 Tax=unclassified Brevundimonas TaxID=2622653 RepID=UPI000CFB127C|nr:MULTISPECIES: GNAT family N-acetyltransferase [unclassified Brevundimonas]PRA24941.1 GNAT family N-acetyltransferase [Brevundimonas sp. MYb27]PQZ75065.1 GNAT family N-acetyltransferase [Brevundimonas sp. MYb31]PRB17543.1 GNAT family N-acetyltransferase [Brevundimonas sp. MYb52]PRB37915.1 GNAT family N-acetyltransferase [Brevundimonas sp. MYb46]PRB42883.1 GNAT family N-acetyltransferase [Brevundimonas sp. MYb33]
MSFTLQVNDGIAAIGRDAWDASATPTGDPFVSYDFLHACEASGSAVPSQGWAARHLSLHDDDGAVIGVMPLYLKGHSQGEYVFDHNWADAYQRAGGRYYPKLLGAVPFTPATGPRFLHSPGTEAATVREALLQGALTLVERLGISSLHVNFPIEPEWRAMTQAGLLPRRDIQFIWRNEGYQTFDDFLAALSSNRRKTIRRERREAQAGLDIRVLTGADITEAHWDAFFAFYMDTGDRKWGRPYLTRDFFARVGASMADRIALVMAFRDETPIAGALNFIGREALYGRQWGALEEVPFLHFELCYYQAIDFAIARGLARVEAGAQGEHKIARGYLPSPVYSAHWIADPALRDPVARYLDNERPAVEAEMDAMTADLSPYRKG